jgi:hypothetical protein
MKLVIFPVLLRIMIALIIIATPSYALAGTASDYQRDVQASCPSDGNAGSVDKYGFFKCNCTSFVSSVLNRTFPFFRNNMYPQVWGNASEWLTRAKNYGIETTTNPPSPDGNTIVVAVFTSHVALYKRATGNNIFVDEYNWVSVKNGITSSDYLYHENTSYAKDKVNGYIVFSKKRAYQYSPSNGGQLADGLIKLSWYGSASNNKYYLEVSKNADMRNPFIYETVTGTNYRPTSNSWSQKQTGTLYWRVRPVVDSAQWSPIWKFKNGR